jgi:hypothetical protein
VGCFRKAAFGIRRAAFDQPRAGYTSQFVARRPHALQLLSHSQGTSRDSRQWNLELPITFGRLEELVQLLALEECMDAA